MKLRLKRIVAKILGAKTTEKLRAWRHFRTPAISIIESESSEKRPSEPCVSVDDFKQQLRSFGIVEGDWLCVHSSLKALHRGGIGLDGKAISTKEYGMSLIKALQELVGEQGLLMMPTDFAGDYVVASDQKKELHVATGKSNRGALTEIFRQMPEAYRSNSPIYTVSVIGKGLEEACDNHWNCEFAMDVGSPWDVFAKHGGKVVFLGCGFDINSFIHSLEYQMKDAYPHPVFFNRPHQFYVTHTNGRRKEVKSRVHAVTWPHGTVSRFCKYAKEKYGIYTQGNIENVSVTVFGAQAQHDMLMKELSEGVIWYQAAQWK